MSLKPWAISHYPSATGKFTICHLSVINLPHAKREDDFISSDNTRVSPPDHGHVLVVTDDRGPAQESRLYSRKEIKLLRRKISFVCCSHWKSRFNCKCDVWCDLWRALLASPHIGGALSQDPLDQGLGQGGTTTCSKHCTAPKELLHCTALHCTVWPLGGVGQSLGAGLG